MMQLMLHWRQSVLSDGMMTFILDSKSLPKAVLLAFCENHQLRVSSSALVDDLRQQVIEHLISGSCSHRLQSVQDSEEREIETDVGY